AHGEVKEGAVPKKAEAPAASSAQRKEVSPSASIAPPQEKKEGGARKMAPDFIRELQEGSAKEPMVREPQVQEPQVREPRVREPQALKPVTEKTGMTASSKQVRKKMSKLRKTIAEKLVEVKNQTAMLTTFNEVDLSAVIAIRTKEKESFAKRYGVKLGFMSFFVKAAVAALKEIPDVNAYIDGDEIVLLQTYDISIAVSTERGLMVPVIRGCDQLSFGAIEAAIEEMAAKARSGKISIDDLRGGSFTITNGGTFGSLLSTPILNPPQSAILGMHTIVKRPVSIDDQVVIRPMMYLALSYDHRLIDGKEAVLFLVHMKKILEDPARLLLDL
ncbi:MAG: dihydrolipoyllysine-residue succinyltransferase, partial [Anaerolineae bacterium]